MSALMSDTVNHLFMWDNKRVWHYGGDAIKALNENFCDPQIGVHWIQTNWEVIHLMPVQIWHSKMSDFWSRRWSDSNELRSEISIFVLYHTQRGGEGISLCKHEPCVDVNVIRVRALQVSITAGFLFLLKTSYVNKSFHIFLISLVFYWNILTLLLV